MTQSSAPLVSVIVPIYKVEEYLRQCLDSVVNQTLKSLEILCVDDGSPDNSGAIAEEYAAKYPCVKVIHKENGGLSSARNAGLDAAAGKYVYFLDSDDFIEPETLETLCARAEKDQLDIIYFNTQMLFENRKVRALNQNYIDYYTRRNSYDGVFTGQSLFAAMRSNREFFPSVCLQLFRRSMIEENHVRFYHGILHEDNLFSFQAMILAQRAGYDSASYYHRRMHGDSIMTAGKSIRNVEGYLVSYAEILAFMRGREVEEDAFDQISEFLYTSVWGNGRRIFQSLPITESDVSLTHGDFVAQHFLDMAKRSGETEFDRSRLKTDNEQLRTKLRRLERWTRLSILRYFFGGIHSIRENGLKLTIRKAAGKAWRLSQRIDTFLCKIPPYKWITAPIRSCVHSWRASRKTGRNPLVSIILPVYNVEEFIEQGMDSLINQTLRRIEIIAVDDGSTDRSLEILKGYAARDSRVKVFTQKNKFAGAARNLGLSHARGEYVIFLDSDDFFEPNLAKDAYLAAKKHKADVVLFGARHYNHTTKEFKEAKWLLNNDAAPKRQPFNYRSCPDSLYRITTPAPWTKMFRRAFVQGWNLQFQRIQNANDLFFTYSALAMAQRIVTVNKALVNYRVGLQTNLQTTKKKYPFCFYDAYKAWHDKLADLGALDTLRRSYVNRTLSGCLHNLRTQKDIGAKKAVFDILHDEALEKLELLGHEESYYDNKTDYQEMLQVASGTFEQYLINQSTWIHPRPEADKAPIVSIVMPCYNAEKHLDLCMRSVLGQTLQEIEVICVDDGSTDSTPQILNRYAQQDPRVRIFSQKNQYAGAARNLGLANARGEYVLFLDSDDFFEESLARDAYCMANAYDADIVLFDAQYYDEAAGVFRDGWFLNSSVVPEKQPFSYKDCPDDLYRISNACPWTKLFRRQFLLDTGLQFQALRHSNDVFFTLSAMAMATRMVTLNKKLVNYRVGNTTNLQSTKEKEPLCFYTAYQAWHDKLAELGLLQTLKRSYVNRALDGCLYNLRSLKDPEAKKTVLELLRSEIFRTLELNGYDAAYFYKDSDYNEYLQIQQGTFESYLAIPVAGPLRNLWNTAQTGVREFQSMPDGSKERNTAREVVVDRILTAMKRCIPSLEDSEGQRAYQFVHETFNRWEFSDAQVHTFRDAKLYRDFATVRSHSCDEMKTMRKRKLIVSLTSYPGRIGMLMPVLDSLYSQSRKADVIVLWLAEEEFPGKEADLPQELLQLAAEDRLTIRWCDDLKPHKKYFYALQEFTEDLVVTVDDDLLYSENMLQSLYESYLLYPRAVSAVRAHLMLLSPEKELLPYNSWIRETDSCIHTPSMQLFATGGAGTLYPPHLFRKEFFDRDAIATHCPLADDLWLKAMELVSGVPVVVARSREPLQYIPDSQDDALKQVNDVQQHNDIQLANILRWTDEVFGKDTLIKSLTDPSLFHPILGVGPVSHHMDQERRALRYQLISSQRRHAQEETRRKKAETQLSQTNQQLKKALDSHPIDQQLRLLGNDLLGQKRELGNSAGLMLKYLVYYTAWVPEKWLAAHMYCLQNGLKRTVKKLLKRG